MSGNSGKITYDLNGNLLKMLHKGVVPGNTAPVTTDDLTYSYTLSNKLNKVTDAMPLSALNGKFGDFKDGANGSANDYVYDNNGNVIVDLNKSIQSAGGGAPGTKGVIYNFLDKPELIRITGRGTVRIVYSADGNVLQRAFIPESGTSAITTTINEFVYQETSATLTASTVAPFSGSGLALSSILFEEGRIWVITPTSTGNGFDALVISGNLTLPNSKEGVYDYYIRDYQENVRMILTEENYTAYNTATMETGRASVETPVFGQSGAANEVTTTRYARPSGWTNNSTDYVSRIGNLAGKTVGPNTLQKVMAGDKVSAEVKYYFTGAPGGGSSGMLANVLGSLIASIGSSGATGSLVKDGVSGINTALTNTPGFVNTVSPTGNPSAPQAYLTIMFFDERFNFISAADGGVSQAQVNATWSTSTAPLALGTVKAPKNGYVYVYISNRSDQHVYFDDFKVAITAGNIIEENHYYSFGLKIAAISSKKLGHVNEGVLKNDYLYNDKELFDDGELNWYNYGFRNYDPQIWRFPQLDPLTDYYAVLTSYQYADNDPIANVDLDGLEP
ncbi:MAG TPA: RHS repeat-associated core domain-containing protein, partial [Agriterribacter sp.]|nr:RHS repeat-associated core domain-containing protein [Agriterribacter sp.]